LRTACQHKPLPLLYSLHLLPLGNHKAATSVCRCLGELEELQGTSVWGMVRESTNKFPNKGSVNGFKRVATLHPESEKQNCPNKAHTKPKTTTRTKGWYI